MGPLTNIAMATRMDPEFTSNIKDIIIMGGNFTGESDPVLRICFFFLIF